MQRPPESIFILCGKKSSANMLINTYFFFLKEQIQCNYQQNWTLFYKTYKNEFEATHSGKSLQYQNLSG